MKLREKLALECANKPPQGYLECLNTMPSHLGAYANGKHEGFFAGFETAREMAANSLEGAWDRKEYGRDCSSTLTPQELVRRIGEEEAS